MGPVDSLSTAVSVLRSNPIVFPVALAMVLLGEASVVLGQVNPLLPYAWMLVTLFVSPFLVAGVIGVLDRAFERPSTFEDFLDAAKAHYLSVLGANVLLSVAMIGVAFAGMFAAFMVAAVVGAAVFSGGAPGEPGVAMIVLVPFLLVLLLVVLVYLFVQFFDTAIVVSGDGAIESFGTSARLVREHFLSVLGYSVLYLLVIGLPRIPDMTLYFLGTSPELVDPSAYGIDLGQFELVLLSVAVAAVLGTLATALGYAYHVSFFRWLAGQSEETARAAPAHD